MHNHVETTPSRAAPWIDLGASLGSTVELAPLSLSHETWDEESIEDPETAETEKGGRLILR